MNNERLISSKEASTMLSVSQWTLRRYPEEMIKPIRFGKGNRKYKLSDIRRLQGVDIKNDNLEEITCVYCRVSSQDQKQKGDLNRQKARLLEYTSLKNYKTEYIFEEVGSGMNDNRVKIKKIFELVNNHKIKRIVVEHKDRLTRFNFQVYKEYFSSHGVIVEWIEDTLNKSFENELVEDMISLMSSFSAKIYGRRSHQNKKKKEEKNEN